MKQLVVLVGCCVVLSGLSGCQSRSRNKSGVDVIIEGGGKFPPSLAGTWKAEYAEDDVKAKYAPYHNWELTFDSNSDITSMKHYFVTVPMDTEEAGVYEPLPGGRQSAYVLGPCETDYNPLTGKIDVKITIDYFQIETVIGTLEGKMTDYITGSISEDGTSWAAEWINYCELAGAERPDPNLIEPKRLVFTRVKGG